MTSTKSNEIEAIHEDELTIEGSPSTVSSILAWTGLTVFTLAVCGMMGGLWMFMLGIQL